MVLSRLVKSITYLSCCGAIGLTCVVCADSASANVAGNSASIKDADIENADTDVVGTISSAASFDNDDLGKAPVSFSADEVYYDKEKDTMTVMGSVEAVHAGYILNADTVSYDRKNNKLEAAGNVKLVEEDGTTMVAEYAELSGDMKSGIIKAMRVLFADNSHITASRAEKNSG
jgi:lipopolysaccharide assembly outer membrane protein LptD (OstA)